MRIKALAGAIALGALVSGAAHAFDAASDATAPAPAPAAGASASPGAGARTARSLECSQKADAQNLHGKPRKRFMLDCKHGT